MKLEFDRLTRDATLAELTSLEALLAVMMSRGVVEDDVINKLWQVYSTYPLSSRILSLERETDEKSFRIAGTSKEIPKFQRRGAIITLGMFAQPKPELVAEHVETLLKIGLGSLGRVRPFLVCSNPSNR